MRNGRELRTQTRLPRISERVPGGAQGHAVPGPVRGQVQVHRRRQGRPLGVGVEHKHQEGLGSIVEQHMISFYCFHTVGKIRGQQNILSNTFFCLLCHPGL